MSTYDEVYWIPDHVRTFLVDMGFHLPIDSMEPYIRAWDDWMASRGDFYDYDDTDSFGRRYKVHRRSIHPAMRVCREWGTLLLNEQTVVACENQTCTDWLAEYFGRTGFMAAAQGSLVKAMGLGTAAWALWFDLARPAVRIRHYDARMIVPLTWDEDGVTECAFVTRVFWRGKAIDQLQLHLRGDLERLGDVEGLEVPAIVPTFQRANVIGQKIETQKIADEIVATQMSKTYPSPSAPRKRTKSSPSASTNTVRRSYPTACKGFSTRRWSSPRSAW